jgi:hypothetical protein
METQTLTTTPREPVKVRGIGLRNDQWDWLYAYADETVEGNVSRLLRIIVEDYRSKSEAEDVS